MPPSLSLSPGGWRGVCGKAPGRHVAVLWLVTLPLIRLLVYGGPGSRFPVLFSGCNTSLPLPALPPAPLTEALAGPRWWSPRSGVSEALRAPSSQPLPACLRLSNSGTWPTLGCVAPSRLDDPLRLAAANAELPARHLPPSPARRGACRVLAERSEGGCGVAQVAKPATPGPAEEAQAGATTGVCADERGGWRPGL